MGVVLFKILSFAYLLEGTKLREVTEIFKANEWHNQLFLSVTVYEFEKLPVHNLHPLKFTR